jgi:hypothetical protein
LEEATPFDHEIAAVVVRVALQLVPVDTALDHVNRDVRVVFLAEGGDIELSTEGLPQGGLKELPGIGVAELLQIRVADLCPPFSECRALGRVPDVHVKEQVAENRAGKSFANPPTSDRSREPHLTGGDAGERREVRQTRNPVRRVEVRVGGLDEESIVRKR